MLITPLEHRTLFSAIGIDVHFGVGGVVPIDLKPGYVVDAKAVGADKTLVQLYPSRAADPYLLTRLDREGEPDPTFGIGGVASLPNGATNLLLTERRGQFVMTNASRGTIYWFNAAGTLRRAFGGGRVTPLVDGQPIVIDTVAFARNGDLLVVAQGKEDSNESTTDVPWFLMRLQPDGTRRLAFGKDGVVELARNTRSFDVSDGVFGQIYTHARHTADVLYEDATGVITVAGRFTEAYASDGDPMTNDTSLVVQRVLPEGIADRRFRYAPILVDDRIGEPVGRQFKVIDCSTLPTRYLQVTALVNDRVQTFRFNRVGTAVQRRASDPIDEEFTLNRTEGYVTKDGIFLTSGSAVTRLRTDLTSDVDWGVNGVSRFLHHGVTCVDGDGVLQFGGETTTPEQPAPLQIARVGGELPTALVQPGSIRPIARTAIIRGTAEADTLVIVRARDQYTFQLNGRTLGTFPTQSIDGVFVDVAGGDDTVRLTGLGATVFGGDGDDLLVADTRESIGTDPVQFFGQAGNDRLLGGTSAASLHGGDGADRITGGSFGNVVRGGLGNDRILGGSAADQLFGDAGKDRIHGAGGPDLIVGGSGNDQLFGDAGEDTLYGSAEADFLYGGPDDDSLNGGPGLDRLFGDEGIDTRPADDEADLAVDVEYAFL